MIESKSKIEDKLIEVSVKQLNDCDMQLKLIEATLRNIGNQSELVEIGIRIGGVLPELHQLRSQLRLMQIHKTNEVY